MLVLFLCCFLRWTSTPLGFTSLKLCFLFFCVLSGMKVETDITSHRLMRITNASYDVRAIAVNKTEIGNEISLQPRSGVWI